MPTWRSRITLQQTNAMKKIAIIGAGPAGCTLGILLHRKGHQVALFNDSRTTDLFVGESLIPAIIPVLRELGIEEKVKAFSVYKPGATVWVNDKLYAEAAFSGGKGGLPPYAYNTNRRHFDALLQATVVEEGIRVFTQKAELAAEGDRIFFTGESLICVNDYFGGEPDLIVDASGRKRIVTNLLKLPQTKGKRMDTALFTHVQERTFDNNYGDIHMHLATKGWCWRIPLPGKTSVGIVINKEKLDTYGSTSEEQFDNYVAQDPKISPFFKNVERVAGVQKYSNYQLQSDRLYGKNWVLVGDAAGFLDPVFSSGLYFSMKYASVLAKTIDEKEVPDLASFEKAWKHEINSWKQMIEIWYNGRLFTNFMMGNDRLNTFMGKRIGKHAVKHFTAIFTGEAVLSKYSMWLLRFMTGPLLDFMYAIRMHRYKVKDLEL